MNNSGRSQKYARLLNHVKTPVNWQKKQLIHQKRADFIQDWNAAEKSNTDIAPVGSLEKLMEIEDELDHVTAVAQNTLYNARKTEKEHRDKLWEDEMGKRDNKILRRLYKQRSEIIEEIPNFWSTAFMSDYGIQIHLNDVDKKIAEFLDSVVVEDHHSNDKSYDIALNFDENPYFENSSLATKWSFSHRNGWVHESGTNIKWKKKDLDIITGPNDEALVGNGSGQSSTDVHTSFFTLFCDPLVAKLQWALEGFLLAPSYAFYKQVMPQVARAIKNSLWGFAPVFFNQACDERSKTS